MLKKEARQLGGIRAAAVVRQKGVERYNSKPNICLFCEKIIKIKDTEKPSYTKTKKFCNQSCAAAYNNHKQPKRKRRIKFEIRFLSSKALKDDKKVLSLTKGELFKNRKNYQSARSFIRKHAYKIFEDSGIPLVCSNCGYSKHVEICHKKAVKNFPKTAMLGEINSKENLTALCPNCHWELDNDAGSSSQV